MIALAVMQRHAKIAFDLLCQRFLYGNNSIKYFSDIDIRMPSMLIKYEVKNAKLEIRDIDLDLYRL